MPSFIVSSMQKIAEQLDQLGLDHAFLGGSVISLLLDHPELVSVRPTIDVDVVIEVVAFERYADLEERLRTAGFDHDMRQGAPRCRWRFSGVVVDIMPAEGGFLGLNTVWFREALATASVRTIDAVSLRVISPPAFLATKFAAFLDRGKGDYQASHDLEDIVTVIDGRANIVSDIETAPAALRGFLSETFARLLSERGFLDALGGHLQPDAASQQRLPALRAKLQQIAALPH